MKNIFLFPGQGSQTDKMLDLLDAYNISYKDEIDLISNTVGVDIYRLLRNGSIDELSQIRNSQLVTFTMNALYFHILSKLNITPDIVAGHSLGQYNALVAVGSLDIESAAKIILKRSELVLEIKEKGALTSVFSPCLKEDIIYHLCATIVDMTKNPISIALYNSKNQIVVGGTEKAINIFENELSKLHGYKCKRLRVPHAFHTALMNSIVDRFILELQNYKFEPPKLPLLLNTTGDFYKGDNLKEECVNQCFKPVLWTSIMEKINDIDDEKIILEVGAGKTLSGFSRNIIKKGKILPCQNVSSIKKYSIQKEDRNSE